MDFEPMRDVTFRGKRLDALTTDELREALCSALKRVRYLESISHDRHRSWAPLAGFNGT